MIVLKWLGIGFAVFAAAVAMLFIGARFADGPIEIIPGGPFTSGEWVAAPVGDWGFVADMETVQIQLEGASTSRTVWIASHDGLAYIPSSLGFPPGKTWHLDAVKDGRAILRIDGQRYRVNLRKLEDPAVIEPIGVVIREKYTPPGGDGAEVWLFEVSSRAS